MSDRGYLIGIDVGGTDTKMGVFRPDGTLLGRRVDKTVCAADGSGCLPALEAQISAVLSEIRASPTDVRGVGVGLPGVVDSAGTVCQSPNLDVCGSAVREQLDAFCEAAIGSSTRLRVINDADAAALGEMWMGSARSYRDVLFVTLGTGVGGGIVSGGKVLIGSHGAAGEIGHLQVSPSETQRCGCGRCGCLEQYVSARGLARMAAQELTGVGDSVLRQLGYADPGRGRALGAKPIFDAARSGDEVACRLVGRFCDILGRALAQVACVVDPEVIVIGGGISRSADVFLEQLGRCYARNAFPPCSHAKVVISSLGNDAGIYGAACATIGD